MEDNILTSIKKLLGIDENYSHFDMDVLTHINGVILILHQLGVCELITCDEDSEWSNIVQNESMIEAVKSYVGLKVRMAFDPPTSGIVSEAMKGLISEYESRILYEVD